MKTIRPYPAPDWGVWLHIEKLRKLDAICLSMNICPEEANQDYGIIDAMRGDEDEGFGGPRIDDREAANTFQRRRFAMREIGNNLLMTEFLAFAERMKWELPPELHQQNGDLLKVIETPYEGEGDKGTAVLSKPINPAIPTAIPHTYPSILTEKRTHVETEIAAHWLGRKKQTLLSWSSKGTGPIRPKKIERILMWSVDEIKEQLGLHRKK